MRLEALVSPGEKGVYPFGLKDTVSFGPTVEAILEDLEKRVEPGIISARFHNTFIRMVAEVVQRIQKETGIRKVVLSGGTFQNRILLERIENQLEDLNFRVYAQYKVPSNDGGIALGQLAIAAKHRELGFPVK
jgi:hydrogenase maturation protein HypF